VLSLAGGLLEGANAIFEHTQMRHFTRSLPNALTDRHRFVSQQPFWDAPTLARKYYTLHSSQVVNDLQR
jgi:hypothetical protein